MYVFMHECMRICIYIYIYIYVNMHAPELCWKNRIQSKSYLCYVGHIGSNTVRPQIKYLFQGFLKLVNLQFLALDTIPLMQVPYMDTHTGVALDTFEPIL